MIRLRGEVITRVGNVIGIKLPGGRVVRVPAGDVPAGATVEIEVKRNGVEIVRVIKTPPTFIEPTQDIASGGMVVSGGSQEAITLDDQEVFNTTEVGGDLSGPISTPTVVGIQGKPVSGSQPEQGQVLYWNGSQWTPGNVSGGGGANSLFFGRPLVTPTLSGWSVYDDGNGLLEYSATQRGIELYHPGNSGYHIMGLWQPAPTPPYTIIALFVYDLIFSYNFMGGGLALIESSSDRNEFSRYTLGIDSLEIIRSNNRTSWNSTLYGAKWTSATLPMFWSKLVDDGTNRSWYFSITGVRWVLAYQTPRTDFINPDMIAVMVNPEQARPIAMTVASFEIIQGVV